MTSAKPAKKKVAAKKAVNAPSVKAKGSDQLLRELALKLPEATEEAHFDMPSFRVRGKIFATARLTQPLAMVKLPVELQQAMSEAHPGVVYPVPGGWGRNGSTFVATDKISKSLLADLLLSAWAGVAPKALVAQHAPKLKRP